MTSYISAAKAKWTGLKAIVQVKGRQTNDLWRVKRPTKFVKQAEEACRIKTTLLDNPPDEFPTLRHESGCSLQYILMINFLLGGDLYKQYCNPFAEGIVNSSEYDIASLLNKARKQML